jgi:aminoglycoside phosphotransferase (APT) family kinase protein
VEASGRAALEAFLRAHGLARAGEEALWTALTGGVSSEIWRVDLPGRVLCVKRALPRLKVSEVWEAPVSRNAYEWKWLQFAARHEPDAVPRPLAHDPAAGLFAMAFLPPEDHPVWKTQLLAGEVDASFAAAVAAALARLHNASAAQPGLAREFDSLENFRALRLEPYLVATARKHPDLAHRLLELDRTTASKAIALVHGDVSPKNILAGPRGPVFLDAECAWYGDPAFDLAFCLNHLVLKALVRPDRVEALAESYSRFVDAYFAVAAFEARAGLEARAAALLPGLQLARVDGKSPVEYLSGRTGLQDAARRAARDGLLEPREHLADLRPRSGS